IAESSFRASDLATKKPTAMNPSIERKHTRLSSHGRGAIIAYNLPSMRSGWQPLSHIPSGTQNLKPRFRPRSRVASRRGAADGSTSIPRRVAGVCRGSWHAVPSSRSPFSSLGWAGGGARLYGGGRREGVRGSWVGGDRHSFAGACAGDQFQYR